MASSSACSKPRFNRDRYGFSSDRLDASSNSGFVSKPQQNRGQWRQKTGKDWCNYETPDTERRNMNNSSWRSQKQVMEPSNKGYNPSISGHHSHNPVIRQEGNNIPTYDNDYGRLKPTVQSPWESSKQKSLWNSNWVKTGDFYPYSANSGQKNASSASYVQGNTKFRMETRDAPCIDSEEMTASPTLNRGERISHVGQMGESTTGIFHARSAIDRGSEFSYSVRNSNNTGKGNDEYSRSMSNRIKQVQGLGKSPACSNKAWEGLHSPIKCWYDESKDEVDFKPHEAGFPNEFRMEPPMIVKESGKPHQDGSSTFLQKSSRGNDNVSYQVRSHISTRSTPDEIDVTSGKSMAQSASRYNQEFDMQKEAKGTKQQHWDQTGLTKYMKTDRQLQQNKKRIGEMQIHDSYQDREPSIEAQKFSMQLNPDIEGVEDRMIPNIIGTCEDMCPIREREQRERLRDLAIFERVNGNPSKTSRELAVKKFCRTFSVLELQPSDVRSLQTLKRTLLHLLKILDYSDFSFDVIHDFLFDRTRAIRQELGMQRIANSQAITMYERIVRFHILSEHELRQRGSRGRLSASPLNLQQLSKSLLALFELYRMNSHGELKNEGEFYAYYVLLNLGNSTHHQSESLSLWFRDCPIAVLKSQELRFARAVLRCYQVGNYKNFFELVQDATFFQYCLMELYFNEVRIQSLAAMNHGGYKLHPISLADICNQLLMMEGDLEELCNLCGLSTGMDANKVRCLFVKQSQFTVPSEIPSYRCPFIFHKRPKSYFAAVVA